jgi:hypothetical protein
MKLLLARPHDFIVEAMRATVKALELEPVRLASLDELSALRSAEFCGAVISMAPTSTVRATLAEVHRAVTSRWPSKPLIITGLSSLQSARLGLRAELIGVEVVGRADHPGPGAALYLTDADLKDATPALLQVMRSHLRLPVSR